MSGVSPSAGETHPQPGPHRSADAAIGGIAGLAGGLLGVGGGFIMVPLQVLWTRTRQRTAAGTSLAAIVPIAVVGAAVYYFGGGSPQLDLQVAVFLMLGSSAGALAGARLALVIPERPLRMLVAALLLVGAVNELYYTFLSSPPAATARAGGEGALQVVLIAVVGLVIGTLSGLTGVGGGILVVPALVLGFGVDQRIAQGTSLLAILPTAALGALVHHRNGDVDLGAAGRMAAAGVPAAILGAVLALWLPQRVLAGVFGLVLAVMAYRMWPRRAEALPA